MFLRKIKNSIITINGNECSNLLNRCLRCSNYKFNDSVMFLCCYARDFEGDILCLIKCPE